MASYCVSPSNRESAPFVPLQRILHKDEDTVFWCILFVEGGFCLCAPEFCFLSSADETGRKQSPLVVEITGLG